MRHALVTLLVLAAISSNGIAQQSTTTDANQLTPSFSLHKITLGRYGTNCHILRSTQENNKCLIIDTSLGDIAALTAYLGKEKLTPIAVLCTHGHHDHVKGIVPLLKQYPELTIYIHPADGKSLPQAIPPAARRLVQDNQLLTLLGIQLKVLSVPGHSPGSVAYYCDKEHTLFSGDTLFKRSIGKASDANTVIEIESIKTKLLVLPDETKVYPGHGDETNIWFEKQFNPFLNN